MTFMPRIVSRASVPYHIMLIPSTGNARRLPNAYACPDMACDFGVQDAGRLYPGQQVEVVVIHTMTREAVRDVMVQP